MAEIEKTTEKTPLLFGSDYRDIAEKDIETKSNLAKTGATPKSLDVYSRVSVVCILLSELCERMTFYSISGNMVIFCTNVLLFTSVQALTVNMVFLGACFVLPVFGGLISDAVSGRYNAILGGALIFATGTLLLSVVAVDFGELFANELLGLSLSNKRWYFLGALMLIAIGTGGIKSNTGPFGAQQVEHMGSVMVEKFFHWYYWFISLGGLFAFTVLVYVQQEVGFALGYAITSVCTVLAVVTFVIPKTLYITKPPAGSQITLFSKIIYCAITTKSKAKEDNPDVSSFLDYASESYGGPYEDIDVEGVRAQFRMFPIFIAGCIYAATYTQVSSTFVLQGLRMDLSVGNFTIPVASLALFNSIMLIILIPFLQKVVYPILNKCHIRPTSLQRLGCGFFIGALAMFVAGGLEMIRKADIEKNGVLIQDVAGVFHNASHLTIFYQVPQYVFTGAGEIFTAVSGIELAYSQAPQNAQGVIIGFYLLCTGMGAFLGSILLNIVNLASAPDEWIPNEINNGYLERYFFLIGAMTATMGVLFAIYAKFVFKYASYSIKPMTVTRTESKFGSLETENDSPLTMSEREEDTASEISKAKAN